MHELALFAGAGGGILGGKLLGWKTVCAVEIDDYARRVLMARQDDGSLPAFPIWDDVQTFDGTAWRGVVDIITGGFPCQDISAAGKGAGIDGAKSGMWHHMARIIREVGPRYVLVENSPMLTSRGLGRVVGDLAAMGYDARWGVLGALDAGAPHKRDRIWIVADSALVGRGARRQGRPDPSGARESELALPALANASGGRCGGSGAGESEQPWRTETERGSETLADAERERCGQVVASIAGGTHGEGPASATEYGSGPAGGTWWELEPDVGRVAHGVAARVDRLRCLGNGQVPSVVRLAWRLLSTRDHQAGRIEHPNIQTQTGGATPPPKGTQ